MSPADGSILWETTITDSFRDAPTDETTVVIETEEGYRVLDLATGAPRFDGTVTGPHVRTDVADGRVFVGDGSGVVARDATTGAELWASDVDLGLLVADAGLVFVLGNDKTITALDAATGEHRWTSAPEPRLQYEVLLGVAGDRLIVTTGQDLVLAYDTATGALTWVFNEEDAGQVKVTPAGAFVIIGRSSQHHIVDAATGAVVRTDADGTGLRVGVGPDRYVDAKTSALLIRPLP